MKAFYKVSVTKQPDGTAIMHKEPPLKGEVIVKVTDVNTSGDFKLITMECDDEQHATNLALTGVELIEENQAVKLAPKFQPKRTLRELNRQTGEEEKREIAAFDMKKYLMAREERLKGVENPPPKKKSRRKSTPKST